MLNTIVVRISNFAVGVVLARTVFGPSVFGLYAVSQIVLAVLLSANELGVSAAIIRWEGDIRSFARTVFTLSVVASTVIYVGALRARAPSIARLLGSPDATFMLRILCICVIIDGLASVPLALLTREFAQGRRMMVDLANFVVSTGVTVWLAFSGQGAMSFAWGSLAGCTVALIVAAIAAPMFVLPGWNTADASQLLQFGLPLAGASLLTLGVFNVDSAIVGATLGAGHAGPVPARLQHFQLAGQQHLAGGPAGVLRRLLAGRRFREGLTDAFSRALGLLMALTVPACVLLATTAEPLIRAVYGERWVGAAHALSLLAMLGLLRVAYGLFYDAMAAVGKRNTLMAIQGLWLVTLIPVLLVGARLGGITGVSAGHVVVAAALVGPAFLWALSRAGIPVTSMARACLRPLLGGVLMATVVAARHPRAREQACSGWPRPSSPGLPCTLPVVYPMRSLLRRTPAPADELQEVSADDPIEPTPGGPARAAGGPGRD